MVQTIMELKTKQCFNFNKHIKIKAGGRQVPDLKYTETSKDKNEDVHRYFHKPIKSNQIDEL